MLRENPKHFDFVYRESVFVFICSRNQISPPRSTQIICFNPLINGGRALWSAANAKVRH